MTVLKIRWPKILLFGFIGTVMQAGAFTRAGEVSVRKVERLYGDWKFYKGAPSGNAYSTSFNDASWPTVCVPHTIDTIAPTQAAEENYHVGDAWYRKEIKVNGGRKKQFLDFEGAMQVAEVWVNGESAGKHDNSGYTGFSFDITGQIGNAVTATVAVKLNNKKSGDIPPGRTDGGPDFFMFSGLYRNVWLVSTNEIHIPFCGQFVTTSGDTVKTRTAISNESSGTANCSVDISIRDRSGKEMATGTLTKSVNAGDSSEFTINAVVSSPQLWSPETPNRYRVYTTVKVGGAVVDDYASAFGFRTLAWSNTGGFLLNGKRYQIKGICHHQMFAWVQNAVPDSRWAKDIEMIKDAGFNAIRCSHYPRCRAFYDAADSLGVLVQPEVPTWFYLYNGPIYNTYSAAFWNRLNACAEEMVVQAYNHPSIILWGLGNELKFDIPTEITRLNNTVHALDRSRHTILANNGLFDHSSIPDVVGLNYQTLNDITDPNMKVVSTEYSTSWTYSCWRGTSSCEVALGNNGWGFWTTLNSQQPRMAGAFLWVFTDYFSAWNKNAPMGIVDEYRLPKQAYYLFRKNFTGKADDNAVNGSATKIVLTSDISELQADGSDFTVVTAALRDNSDRCINSTANVTFSVTGPVTPLGPLTRAAAAGKLAIILRATTATGTITIDANSTGLPSASISIATVPPFDGKVGVKESGRNEDSYARVVAPKDKSGKQVGFFDIKGRKRNVSVSAGLRASGVGVYIVQFEMDGVMKSRKMLRMAR